MNEADVYSENQRIFDSGIDSGIKKSPYQLTRDELDHLEKELQSYSGRFGEPAVLVAWGQPYFTLEPERRYHPSSEIKGLHTLYEKYNMKGICPKAKASFDLNWISEQRKRLEHISSRPPESIDLEEHVRSLQNTQF
jgi:hypothetical protein